jgi:hypothetical protein
MKIGAFCPKRLPNEGLRGNNNAASAAKKSVLFKSLVNRAVVHDGPFARCLNRLF